MFSTIVVAVVVVVVVVVVAVVVVVENFLHFAHFSISVLPQFLEKKKHKCKLPGVAKSPSKLFF